MIPVQRVLVLILLAQISHFKSVYCSTSTNFTSSSTVPHSVRNENSFTLNSGISLASEENRKSENGRDDSIPSVVPSFSYQFHTNDHEHLDGIVLAHQNSNDAVSNGGSASLSGNSGSKRISAGANLETVSSPSSSSSSSSSSATRRQDTFSSSPYIYGSVAGPSPTSYVPYQQNQDWRGGYLNNNIGAYEASHSQQHQNPSSLSPQAVLQQNPHLSQKVASPPTDSRISADFVSPSKKASYNKKQQWGNVSAAAAGGNEGRQTQRPVKHALKQRRNPIRQRNSTLSSTSAYPRLQQSNRRVDNGIPINHYHGRQLLAPGNPLNNRNISLQGQVYSGPVSRTQKSTYYPNTSFSGKKQQKRRKILTSRADTYQPYDEADDDDDDDEIMDDDHNTYNHEHETYSNDGDEDQDNEDDEENNEQQEQYNYYNQQQQQALPPALRDFGQQGGGLGGSGPGPLPPPPVPVKGSIDYILIPLILIGLAGPIFVVLYVVLGSFEFRIAPVIASRSLQGSLADYQPYIDTLTSSVGRALEKYECVDYASCKVRGFCSQFDYLLAKDSNSLLSLNSLESVLSSYAPSEYKDTLKGAIARLMNGEMDNCEKYKCSSVIGKLSGKF